MWLWFIHCPLWFTVTTVKKVVKHCKHADLAIMLSGVWLCKSCTFAQTTLLGSASKFAWFSKFSVIGICNILRRIIFAQIVLSPSSQSIKALFNFYLCILLDASSPFVEREIKMGTYYYKCGAYWPPSILVLEINK